MAQKPLIFHLLLLTILLAMPISAVAGARAQYQNGSGKTITFLVEVTSPAPSSLIVQHFHPTGITIIGTSPQANKVNPGSGIAKWFLKNIQPGTYRFSLSFNKSVTQGDIRLILRYRDPASGSFKESAVSP